VEESLSAHRQRVVRDTQVSEVCSKNGSKAWAFTVWLNCLDLADLWAARVSLRRSPTCHSKLIFRRTRQGGNYRQACYYG